MQFFWTGRRFLTISALTVLGLSGPVASAQRSGAGGSPSSTNTGANVPSGTTGTRVPGNNGNIPSINNPTVDNNGPFANRPIFVSGKVVFDDGAAPSTQIRVERVCNGNPRLEGYVDSKGRFSFQLGSNNVIDTDASNASSGTFGRPDMGYPSSSSRGGFGNVGGMGRNDMLWGCELRATYPGYRSDIVDLASKHSFDNIEVGTIILHRLANVQGTTISVTSALAPKQAVKDYEKGMQLAQKGKFEEAEARFQQATEKYPKYAVAWFALGQMQQRAGKPQDARKSFEAAAAADNKYVSPYDQLALLAAQDGKWEDAASYSKQVISLNPVEFPSSFWYNALANYNLKKNDAAEKSTVELMKLDPKHRYPEAESLMAQLSIEKGNLAEAATHLRAYLALAPNAKNAEQLKQALTRIEQASAEKKAATPAQ